MSQDLPDVNPPLVALGTELGGKYRIVRRLGHGGMGEVYQAEHTLLRRRFAIKFLRAEHLHSSEMIARFKREAQVAGQIEHDHVAAVTDFGVTAEGTPYFVMEYLEGSDLGRMISDEGPLTVPRATTLLIQACHGVAAAHSCGVIHRDLKPENLFVSQGSDGAERVKILDFGIAKLQVSPDGLVTHTGATLGTPCYMSPEQARGERDIDLRTDIYSLGAVLYEALAGERAHQGSSYNEIIYQIISRQPISLAQRRTDVPPALVSAIARAMHKEPSARFATADDFADALELTLKSRHGGLPTQASSAVTATQAAALMPTVPRMAAENQRAARGSHPTDLVAMTTPAKPTSRRGLLLLVLLVVLGVGGALLTSLRTRRGADGSGSGLPSHPAPRQLANAAVTATADHAGTTPPSSFAASPSNAGHAAALARSVATASTAAPPNKTFGKASHEQASATAKPKTNPMPKAEYDLHNPYEP